MHVDLIAEAQLELFNEAASKSFGLLILDLNQADRLHRRPKRIWSDELQQILEILIHFPCARRFSRFEDVGHGGCDTPTVI